ncbi:hypothetical protein [Cardiobacterium valvarum]|uniref:DUF4440 domain-containing protein n=1 Tax=Cardiobacterium valvarum TaxID=194702 RepID=A0A381EA03_9GAMM|nr:hypothetical protein [Cardiobacterium valvarum]SUX23544.1 Uncharacterised protein [Cardiobacterium valvarum]
MARSTRIKAFICTCALSLAACATLPGGAEKEVGETAEHFMQTLVHSAKGLEKQTIADIAFLDNHTTNSEEGQKRLRRALQMMGQYLRQAFTEAGIDSDKAVFTAKKMDIENKADDEQALVILYAYQPDKSKVVDGTALITRWRKTADGWKLDMNPYLDNFRSSK